MRAGYDLTSHLTGFCRVVRDHGLPVGPQESIDALRALDMMDVDPFRG